MKHPIPKLKSALETTGIPHMPWSDSYAKLRAAVEEVIGELAGEAESAEELVRAMLSIPWSNGARVTARLTELVLARDASLLSRTAPEWIAVDHDRPETLPPPGKLVLCFYDQEPEWTEVGRRNGKNWSDNSGFTINTPTHWRRIEGP